MKLFNIFLSITLCALFLACSSDDDMTTLDEGTPNEYIITIAQSHIKSDVFKTQVIGFGWRNVAEYEYDLKTNTFSEKDFFGRDEKNPHGVVVGGGPLDYFFGEDAIVHYSVTIYPPMPEIDGAWAHKNPYTYDAEKGCLAIPNTPVRYVLEQLKDNKLTMVQTEGNGHYSRIILERMTVEELAKMNATYRPAWEE